jgi:hypothetical protein
MTAPAPLCYRCGHPANDRLDGVIYVRREIAGGWGSVPICTDCWGIEEPDRAPVRALFDEDA